MSLAHERQNPTPRVHHRLKRQSAALRALLRRALRIFWHTQNANALRGVHDRRGWHPRCLLEGRQRGGPKDGALAVLGADRSRPYLVSARFSTRSARHQSPAVRSWSTTSGPHRAEACAKSAPTRTAEKKKKKKKKIRRVRGWLNRRRQSLAKLANVEVILSRPEHAETVLTYAT